MLQRGSGKTLTTLDTSAPKTEAAETAEMARGGVLSFFGAATSAVFGLLVIVVLGRTLGDEGSGVVLQAVAVFTIALGFARFGMDSTALWILPRLQDDHPQLVRRTAWYLIAVSGIVGAICAVTLMIVSTRFDATLGGNQVAAAVHTAAPFLPAAAMLMTALSSTRALRRVTAYVWIGNVALPAMRPALILIAVGLGAGLTGATVAWALPLVPALFVAFIVLYAHLRGYEPGGAPLFRHKRIARRSLGYALPRVASATLEQLLIWISVLGVGVIAGSPAAGIYGTASRFIAAGMIIDAALRVVVSPMFSRLQNRADTTELTLVYRTATVWLVLFSTPVFIMLAAFAPVALALAGEEFVAGETVVLVMSAGALATFFAGNIHSLLLMSGRSGLAAMNKLIVVAVTIGLLVLLTPVWGITGAAFAWSFACVLDAALAMLEVRYLLHLRVPLTAGVKPFLVGAGTFGVAAIFARLAVGATWTGLALALALGGVAFVLWCAAARHTLHLTELVHHLKRSSSNARQGGTRDLDHSR